MTCGRLVLFVLYLYFLMGNYLIISNLICALFDS